MSITNSPPSHSHQDQPITLSPALPQDYHTLSTLECLTFYDEPFSLVAWGPLRASEAAIAARAKQFASPPRSLPNQHASERRFYTKAVLGNGEVVGFAEWKFVTGRREEESSLVEKKKEDGDGNGDGDVNKKTTEEVLAEKENSWGVGANFKFCEDVFLTADKHMLDSCLGKDYCKLTTLVVSPDYQRRGIGTMLLEAGLKQADEGGLQTILAASPNGEGLYKRFGFREVVVMELKLWEYEGGEELVGEDRITRHVVMRRPGKGDV